MTRTSACGMNLWISAMRAATFPASLYVASETRMRGSGEPAACRPRIRRGHAAIPACVPVGRFAIFLGYDFARGELKFQVGGSRFAQAPDYSCWLPIARLRLGTWNSEAQMSSPIEMECPNCEKVLKVPPAVFGKKIKCKHCEHAFVVRGPGREAARAARSPPVRRPPPAPAKNPFAGRRRRRTEDRGHQGGRRRAAVPALRPGTRPAGRDRLHSLRVQQRHAREGQDQEESGPRRSRTGSCICSRASSRSSSASR